MPRLSAKRIRDYFQQGDNSITTVATNGITGVAEELTRANYELAMALAQGLRILVITRVEIEALASTEQLVLLFKEKLCELTVSGTLFL